VDKKTVQDDKIGIKLNEEAKIISIQGASSMPIGTKD
jgi:hypothetical protein